jgi:hypothetical protein
MCMRAHTHTHAHTHTQRLMNGQKEGWMDRKPDIPAVIIYTQMRPDKRATSRMCSMHETYRPSCSVRKKKR